jgi:hypothetical protein
MAELNPCLNLAAHRHASYELDFNHRCCHHLPEHPNCPRCWFSISCRTLSPINRYFGGPEQKRDRGRPPARPVDAAAQTIWLGQIARPLKTNTQLWEGHAPARSPRMAANAARPVKLETLVLALQWALHLTRGGIAHWPRDAATPFHKDCLNFGELVANSNRGKPYAKQSP